MGLPRLPYARDVEEATQWVFGVSPRHTGARQTGRVYQAKKTYWAVLYRFGFSQAEIGRIAGCDRSTVAHALVTPVKEEMVQAVIERARVLVYNASCAEDLREVRADVPTAPERRQEVWPLRPSASGL